MVWLSLCDAQSLEGVSDVEALRRMVEDLRASKHLLGAELKQTQDLLVSEGGSRHSLARLGSR